MTKYYLSFLADAAVREVKEETGIDAGECVPNRMHQNLVLIFVAFLLIKL